MGLRWAYLLPRWGSTSSFLASTPTGRVASERFAFFVPIGQNSSPKECPFLRPLTLGDTDLVDGQMDRWGLVVQRLWTQTHLGGPKGYGSMKQRAYLLPPTPTPPLPLRGLRQWYPWAWSIAPYPD